MIGVVVLTLIELLFLARICMFCLDSVCLQIKQYTNKKTPSIVEKIVFIYLHVHKTAIEITEIK